MGDRKQLTISSEVFNRLEDVKASSTTWDDFLNRMVSSVDQDQSHLDRATLQDFTEPDDTDITLRASPDGKLELQFLDDSGTPMGLAEFDKLDSQQEVHVNVATGEQSESN